MLFNICGLKSLLFWGYNIRLIDIEITKPIAPIINNPAAETFEIVLNSCIVGFFNNLHTRKY